MQSYLLSWDEGWIQATSSTQLNGNLVLTPTERVHDSTCIRKKKLTNSLVIVQTSHFKPRFIIVPEALKFENSKYSRAVFRTFTVARLSYVTLSSFQYKCKRIITVKGELRVASFLVNYF
jgi:hypothetical protein